MNDLNEGENLSTYDDNLSTKSDQIDLYEHFDSVLIEEESTDELIDIKCENKCRGCESQVNLCSIFDNTENLSKKFTLCTSLKINKNDQLPQHICKECLNELKIAYIFRMKCERTQYKLQIALKKIERRKNDNSINKSISNPLEIQENKHELIEITDKKELLFNFSQIKTENNTHYENLNENINDVNESDCNDLKIEYLKEEEEEGNNLEESDDQNDESNSSNENTTGQLDPSEFCEGTIFESFHPTTSSEKPKSPRSKKSYICETCGKEFKKFVEFNVHKKTHGLQRFQCKTCDKWFQQNCDLTRHALIHTGERNFKCDLCDKRFLLKKNVNRHMREVHKVPTGRNVGPVTTTKTKPIEVDSIEDKGFECEKCHKILKSEAKLNLHKSRHISKEFICQYCGKISKTRKDSQTHIRIHTGEKPYECKICNKRFTQLSHLKSHMATHTDEKPFKCEVCGLAFREARSYKQHKFLHSGEKRHKCLICEKAFARRDTLTVHMRIHTGERPYHCNICPRKFHQSFDLTRHKLLHIGKKSFKCNFCDKGFVLRNNLAIHVKRVHNGEKL